MNVVIRSQSDPAALSAAAAKVIHQMDRDLPLYNVLTMRQRLAASLAQRRFSMILISTFALFALALATVGTYGVISYLVTQGTKEIGIRMALGSTPQGIMQLIVQRGMMISIAGVAIGTVSAMVGTRFMQSLLFGVNAADPFTYAFIAALLILVTLAAISIPARRASQTDPMVSLRTE